MRRVVEIYIVDPDEDLPPEKSVVYQGERKVTDLTDSELFFELSISDLVTKHNEVRDSVKKVDKFTGTEVSLKPIRVKDLKMMVVNIATF
jgi:hypothetical protein